MTPIPKPIDYDELYYTDGHVFLYNGRLFTGVAERYYPNGATQVRYHFRQGKQDGNTEVYFMSGAIQQCTPYVNGVAHGRASEWLEDGRLRVEKDIEFGFLMSERHFDNTGAMVSEYHRPDDDPLMSLINARRGQTSGIADV